VRRSMRNSPLLTRAHELVVGIDDGVARGMPAVPRIVSAARRGVGKLDGRVGTLTTWTRRVSDDIAANSPRIMAASSASVRQEEHRLMTAVCHGSMACRFAFGLDLVALGTVR
jgi:hypothetical protein